MHPKDSVCIFRLLKRNSTPILAKTDAVAGILLYRDRPTDAYHQYQRPAHMMACLLYMYRYGGPIIFPSLFHIGLRLIKHN